MTFLEDNATDVQVFKSGGLTVRAAYLRSIKYNTNSYLEPENNQSVLILSTLTIEHTCLDVSVVTYMSDIPRSYLNGNQSTIAIPMIPIFVTNKDQYYILYEVMHKYQSNF